MGLFHTDCKTPGFHGLYPKDFKTPAFDGSFRSNFDGLFRSDSKSDSDIVLLVRFNGLVSLLRNTFYYIPAVRG